MMNQEGIFKKVGQILNELQDQYDFLARNPGQLNDLELELFLANANFLSDHIQIIKKFNSNKPLKEIPEHTEDQSDVTAVTEIVPILSIETFDSKIASKQFEAAEPERELKMEKEKTLEELEAEYAAVNDSQSYPEPLKFEFLMDNNVENDKFEFEEKSIESIFDRPLSKEEEAIIAEKQRLRESVEDIEEETEVVEEETKVNEEVTIPEPVVIAQEVIPEPVQASFITPIVDQPEEQPEEKTVVQPVVAAPVIPVFEKPADKVVKEPEILQGRPTLNDMLASKSTTSSTLNEENNNKAKITDLKQAINLNEKLLYIKDLFNGYNLAYAEAIELINKMPDFKTADNFLRNNYAVKNNWTDKQSTVDKFYDLLNQHFDATK